jgi:hypothetical protein
MSCACMLCYVMYMYAVLCYVHVYAVLCYVHVYAVLCYVHVYAVLCYVHVYAVYVVCMPIPWYVMSLEKALCEEG